MSVVAATVIAIVLMPWAAAGAATSAPPTFAGYRLSSTAAGIELLYNQGRELDLTIPSATTSAITGAGHALAAPLYPGAVGGNPGATIKQFLGSQLPPQLADALGQLQDPLKAEAYASGPNDSSFPPGGPPQVLTDTAHVDPDGSHAKATGTYVNAGALTVSAVSETVVAADAATTTATSTISDLTIAGLVHLGRVTSTAKASTDGSVGKASGSTTIAALSVAGMSISLSPFSLTLGTTKVPLNLGGLLNPVLKGLGIELLVSPETHMTSGAKSLEHAPALTISIAPPGNGGNTFLVTVGGAVAQAQAGAPFKAPADLVPTAPSSLIPPDTSVGPPSSPSSPTSPETLPPSAPSNDATLPPAQAIAAAPAASEKSTAVTAGLVALAIIGAAASAFGLAKVRDDVLAEKLAGGRCPLERSDQ